MESNIVRIELAGAPMGKERVRVTRAGHAYTPERTVNYESRLALAAQQVMDGRPLLEGPLIVVAEAYMPVAASKPKKWRAAALSGQIRPTKKPDADNIAKLLDSVNLVVWQDDAQIVDLRVTKWFSVRPRLVVIVQPLPCGVFE